MDDILEMCNYFNTGGTIAVDPNDPKSRKIPLIRVYRWCFKFRPTSKGPIFKNFNIYVKGYKDSKNGEQLYWESSKLLEVRSQRIVVTKNTGYYLYTEMDKRLSRAEGFKPAFNEYFKNGFADDWKNIVELFGNYMMQKTASVHDINRQLMVNSMNRHMPKMRFFRQGPVLSQEEQMCKWIEKNDAWNEKVAHKRKDDLDNLFQCIPRRKALATISQTFEPINGSWTAEDVEKLYSAVTLINPCSDSDWNKVMHLFDQDRSLAEVKEQAKVMLHNFGKKASLTSTLVKKLQHLTPNGELPKQGTLRRQVLSNEICKILYFYENQMEEEPKEVDYDSDEEFVNDTMTNSALDSTSNDELSSSMQMGGIQFSLVDESYYELGSADDPIDIGDDFGIPSSRLNPYMYRYQAEQVGLKFRCKSEELEEECQEMFSDEECHILRVDKSIKREIKTEKVK